MFCMRGALRVAPDLPRLISPSFLFSTKKLKGPKKKKEDKRVEKPRFVPGQTAPRRTPIVSVTPTGGSSQTPMQSGPVAVFYWRWRHWMRFASLGSLTQLCLAGGFSPHFLQSEVLQNGPVPPLALVVGTVTLSSGMVAVSAWAQRRYVSRIELNLSEDNSVLFRFSNVNFFWNRVIESKPEQCTLHVQDEKELDERYLNLHHAVVETVNLRGKPVRMVVDFDHLRKDEKVRLLTALRTAKLPPV